MDELFSYKSLVHAVAGMTGGVTAISTFYPLNVVRTRLQITDRASPGVTVVMKEIIKEEGIGGLYQGWQSAVVSLGASNFVYFYTYNGFKAIYKKLMTDRGLKPTVDPITNLMIASAAGVVNVLATTPLWVVGTRLTVQRKKLAKGAASTSYKGIWDCLTRIATEEGIAGLWNGVMPSLVLVSNPSIQFVTYENLKGPMQRYAKARGRGITVLEFFVMGAIAKAVATVFTYPLQVAQSRLRAGKKDDDGHKYTSTVDVLRRIFAKKGFWGWFNGMEAKLLQTVSTAAFQFLTYEQVAKFVFFLLLKDNKTVQVVSKGFGDNKGK